MKVQLSRASHKAPVVAKTSTQTKLSVTVCFTNVSIKIIGADRRKARFFVSILNCCHVNKITVPVLTSTLNGCSSPFTAHKIHSNNCKHNVPIQQLLRHLLLRTANKTIVNPAVVPFCLGAVLFTSRYKQTDNGGKS